MKPFLAFKKKKKTSKKLDLTLLFLVIAITLFGVLMVYNASIAEALRDFNDKYHFLKLQFLWAIIGFAIMLTLSFVNFKVFYKLSPFIFIINLILLVLVLIPGIGMQIKGAKRWLDLGFFVLQPAELVKLSLTLYLSAWLAKKRSFWNFIILLTMLTFLIILQPDMGTAVVIIVTAFLVYYISGASILELFPIGLIGLLIGLLLIFNSPYRKDRLLTFLNPSRDPLGSSYHIRQVLIALSSGGLWGLGLGQSRQKYEYLPEATADSIFAIVAEETGLIGSLAVIIVLFSIVYRGLSIAKGVEDIFAKLTAAGISFWIGLQTIVNLGAMVALLPLTGLPLPFISYGGSSLIINLTSIGILLNISRYKEFKKK